MHPPLLMYYIEPYIVKFIGTYIILLILRNLCAF